MFGKFFQSKLFTFLALGMVFWLVLSLLRIQSQKVIVEKKIRNFQDKIMELENSNAVLGQLLDYFKSDAYLEREAKIKLNVKRPGEEVVFLRENDTDPPALPTGQKSPIIWGWGYLTKLWYWLRSIF